MALRKRTRNNDMEYSDNHQNSIEPLYNALEIMKNGTNINNLNLINDKITDLTQQINQQQIMINQQQNMIIMLMQKISELTNIIENIKYKSSLDYNEIPSYIS